MIDITPGDRVADYAKPKAPALIVGKGYKAVARYIDGTAGTSHPSYKVLTVKERDGLAKAGLGIILIWETYSKRALSGAPAGVIDGKLAAQQAHLLGYPAGMPIIATVDVDTNAKTAQVAAAYWRAFSAACAPYVAGCYGDYDVANVIGLECPLMWQPAARWWSRYRVHPTVKVLQSRKGSEPGIDNNQVLKPVTVWDGKP